MLNHEIQWAAPSPLWSEAAGSADPALRRALRRPVILRFASDTFMEEFASVMTHDPRRLGGYLALPETWRAPAPTPAPPGRPPEFTRKVGQLRASASRVPNDSKLTLKRAGALAPAGRGAALQSAASAAAAQPLKLYQPAHQRFYLVAACLVCRVAGLPDKTLDTAREERVGYVVRRLYQVPTKQGDPPNPIEEYAFVVTPHGPGWQKVGAAAGLIEGEEVMPLFSVNFDESAGRRRRVFGAMIPVGKREVYMGAGTHTPQTNGASAPNATPKTARKIHFRMQITEPWKNLLREADDARTVLQDAPNASPAPSLQEIRDMKKENRELVQTLSWFLLLDFAKYLQQYLPTLWAAVLSGSPEDLAALSASEQTLYQQLADLAPTAADKTAIRADTLYTEAQFAPSMLEALRRIGDPAQNWEDKLDNVTAPYDRAASPASTDWPDFIFPLADLERDLPLPPLSIEGTPADESGEEVELSSQNVAAALAEKQEQVDKFVVLVVRALPVESNAPAPAPPLAARQVLDTAEGTFVLRCVFERPFCGPLDPPVLSEPSASFQMAGFFDPDAPARPIRIALPIDTTPAGLRKFDKNTAFMISDVLCGQMQRLKGITFADMVLSVLPWPFRKKLKAKGADVGPCRDKKGIRLGMICTFSLPIITICALILLMVIVLLFNFIFRWIPFFIMCFPLPGFKGKKR